MCDDRLDRSQGASPRLLVQVAGLCVAAIVGFVLIDVLFLADGQSWKREGGGLETVSAVLYAAAVLTFFASAPVRVWGPLFHVPALLALFALRELDFDKAFTQSGILSLRFYSGDSPLRTKLIGGTCALFAAYVLLRTVWRGGPAALRAARDCEDWPWFAVLAGVLIVVTKAIDGLGRKLSDFGIRISENVDQVSAIIEETGEAFIPVCAILAIVARWKGRES